MILQRCILGIIFIAFLIYRSSTTVVFSANQVVVGVAGGLQTLDFSMSFVFATALIDFRFSFSIQIASFSFKVRSLVFILVVCVIVKYKIQNTEVMDITDTANSLLFISLELLQQDTADHLERHVRQLFQYLCSHQIGG